MTPPRACLLLSAFLLPVLPLMRAGAQTDDFNDGNDDGWTRLDPIGVALGTEYAHWQIQAGLYRLQCETTPDPLAGPARISSFRGDTVLTDFVIVVDVVSWDDSQDQAMGILARVQPDPGPGAVSGYSLNYQARDHDIEINRLVGETPVNLARVPLSLLPGESWRFVFTGRGDQLKAAVYSLEEPLLPVVEIAAEDSTYASGFGGIFAFDADGMGRVDVTFDNYAAGAPAVPELTARLLDTALEVSWPRLTGAWHLERSSDLTVWTDVRYDGYLSGGRLAFGAAVAEGKEFFRLAEGWAVPVPDP